MQGIITLLAPIYAILLINFLMGNRILL